MKPAKALLRPISSIMSKERKTLFSLQKIKVRKTESGSSTYFNLAGLIIIIKIILMRRVIIPFLTNLNLIRK